jgi:hypothetical protein
MTFFGRLKQRPTGERQRSTGELQKPLPRPTGEQQQLTGVWNA